MSAAWIQRKRGTGMQKRHILGIVGVFTLALALLVPAFAQKGQRPDVGPQGAIGRISAVSTSSITVDTRKDGSKTFSIGSATTVTIDKQPSTADKLVVGQFAAVTSSDGTSTTAINARVRRARPTATPAQAPTVETPPAPAAPPAPAPPAPAGN